MCNKLCSTDFTLLNSQSVNPINMSSSTSPAQRPSLKAFDTVFLRFESFLPYEQLANVLTLLNASAATVDMHRQNVLAPR